MNEKGTFLRVLVRPNSKNKELIEEINPDFISINLAAPAKEGKANTELVKRLSKLLKISTSSIKLVVGHKSREKVLLIDGLSAEEVKQKLSK
ncbi:DUF167 domain-containing protein [Candidatus Thorarchaeota archaeon]|nr:MAG: DUF167 domain-containing protein [Candidatus Thorarchaeota archaeon]